MLKSAWKCRIVSASSCDQSGCGEDWASPKADVARMAMRQPSVVVGRVMGGSYPSAQLEGSTKQLCQAACRKARWYTGIPAKTTANVKLVHSGSATSALPIRYTTAATKTAGSTG